MSTKCTQKQSGSRSIFREAKTENPVPRRSSVFLFGLWLKERGIVPLKRTCFVLQLKERGMLYFCPALVSLQGLQNEEYLIWSGLVLVYGLSNEEYYCWSVLVLLYGLDNEEFTTVSRLATSRPLGERSEPCLAAKRPTASDEVARGLDRINQAYGPFRTVTHCALI